MHGDGDTGAGVHLRDFFHAQGVCKSIGTAAAILLGVGDAHQTILVQLSQQVEVVGLFLVHLFCQRTNFVFSKATKQFLLEQMAFVKFKIHNYLLIK